MSLLCGSVGLSGWAIECLHQGEFVGDRDLRFYLPDQGVLNVAEIVNSQHLLTVDRVYDSGM